jgi:hypothetical protein
MNHDTMPIINVDVDGVLYDFTGAMRNEVVAQMGIAPDSLPTPTEWRLHKAWPLTWAQVHGIMHDGIAQGRLFRRGEVIDFGGATLALRNIMALGWHVRLVTAKTFDDTFITMQARKNMLDWVYENEIPHHTISFSDRSGKLSYTADAVIDDKPSLEWCQWNAENFLFDQSWNQDVDDTEYTDNGSEIMRVRSIADVYEILKGSP